MPNTLDVYYKTVLEYTLFISGTLYTCTYIGLRGTRLFTVFFGTTYCLNYYLSETSLPDSVVKISFVTHVLMLITVLLR